MTQQKTILRALAGETLPTPPIWMMAAEVTLQPIRRYGFDAAILFADILLLPQALGADLWFVTGEGPRLSTVTTEKDFAALKPAEVIHETLNPIYETVKILSRELPSETTLIGFTYMIAGKGTPDQGPAHALKAENRALFQQLIDLITAGSIEYLSMQIQSGAEVVKLFDSWAGSLQDADFVDFSIKPMQQITAALKARHPDTPVIAFPRGAGTRYAGLHADIGADCIAIDDAVDASWAAAHVQTGGCVQGNLKSSHMVTGGGALVSETRRIVKALNQGPHIFNLGHGITPDADPENVTLMIDTIRNS